MDQFKIYKLIWCKMKGVLTEEQKAELEEWVGQSPSRSVWMERLFDEKNLRKDIDFIHSFNNEQGWEQIERRITPKVKRLRWWSPVAGIAATVILLLAIGSLLLLWSPERDIVELARVEKLLPGEFNAILTIDETDTLLLQDSVTTSIDKDNMRMAEVKNGALAYLADASLEPVNMKIEVPERSEFHFELSDGSELWMNAGSKVIFQQPFANDKRSIYMEGEVFFKVEKDKKRPFIVDICGKNSQEVLGTSFNVKAYPEDDYQQSVLVEGSVLWHTAKGLERIMEPGQLLHYDAEKEAIQVSDVDVYSYVAWKEGRFVFDGATLENIMQALSRWYGVTFVYADSSVKDLRFSIDVQRYEDLATILRMLELTQKVKFEINGTEIRIIKYQ